MSSSVEFSAKRLLIGGRPTLVLAGEVHYFRLDRDQWADRIGKLADSGCTAVASYIPWLFHELPDGTLDVSGTTLPERDVGAFIDLCAERGLHFIARPGPFVMAELKNEGLPFRLYDEHPEISPITWDARPVSSRTVDYLAPAFLDEVRRWYGAIMPVLADRLLPRGGNVIAVQLDNEVGMLSWVTNEPDLTDLVLGDFTAWLARRYDESTIATRYPRGLSNAAVRSPGDDYAPALHYDLGYYMRDRFRRYLAVLRDYAQEGGVGGVPYIVNIHGTSDGHAWTFPIGISQLSESYSGIPGFVSGTDIYLGDLTLGNVADLYLVNAFTDAVNNADQPLTSMEFEAGNANYGDDLTTSVDPAASELKTRLCLAQGNRLLNYYLFAGGINRRLDAPVGDGNDRIGFTGERHGFAAPIGPEGQLTPAYHRTAHGLASVRAVADRLADMREERDDLAVGLVLDHYLTEYCHPASATRKRINADLEVNRGGGPRQVLARALVLGGYRFGAIDLHRQQPDVGNALALAPTRHLDPLLQRRLVDYLHSGGRMLLYGPLPTHDMLGAPCTIL
ncbi:MAG: beta-galactosidase, partial [Mycobacterium sp.]|nr:beta-galactosidase [Mycobacterium sp.]